MRLRFLCLASIWFILSLPTVAWSQNLLTSPRRAVEGQVYRLTMEQAQMAARGQLGPQCIEWLGDKVESFPGGGTHSPLAPGQYLVTQVVGNQVHWNYKQVPGYSVILENDGANLMVKVMDFAGRNIEDAVLMVGETFVPYDPRTQSYSLPSTSLPAAPSALLEVDVAGIVQFYSLTQAAPERRQNDPDGRYRGGDIAKRWLWWPTRRFIINPIVWTVRLPYDIARSIVKRRLFGWPAWLVYRTKWLVGLPKRALTERHPVAFLMTNQPKYRPGDTVKFKGYVTSGLGRRLHGKLDLLYTDRHGKTRVLTTVKPEHSGSYHGAFVLHDSLEITLGATVAIVLTDAKVWKGSYVSTYRSTYTSWSTRLLSPSTSFVYEDYELRAYTFHVRAEQETHWMGKPAALYLEAKDMNNLTVPDARVKLWVRSGGMVTWLGPREILRDTLWQWEGLLDPSGETRIELPMDVFPEANFPYTVEIECRTSDNELKKHTLNLKYIHDAPTLEVTARGDSIHIMQLRANQPQSVKAKLTLYPAANGEPVLEREVELPATLYWPSNFRSLLVATDALMKTWTPAEIAPVWIRGFHNGDSLHIMAESPAGIDFAYRLFEGNREIGAGHGSRVAIHRRARAGSTYHLTAIYLVNGTERQESCSFNWAKKDLLLSWQNPQTIYPGQTVDLALEVRNARGRAVRHADLTAYAVNGRFGGHDPTGVPTASKGPRKRRQQGYWRNAYQGIGSGNFRLAFAEWSSRTGIDSLPWYQFLNPDSNGYLYRHPIEHNIAEVAPFLVRGGEIQPVQILYIDGEPVYFAWTHPALPYSFRVSPGHHRIEVRLPDFGILIDTFHVQAGYKTIFSYDLDHLPLRVFAKPMQASPVPGEQQVIDTRTMMYRGLGYQEYLASVGDGRTWLPLATGMGSAYLVGPLPRASNLTIQSVDRYQYTFPFENQYEYDFGPTYVKMVSQNKKTRMPYTFAFRPNLAVEDRAWVRDSAEARWRRLHPPTGSPGALQPSSSHQPSHQRWTHYSTRPGRTGRIDVSFNEIAKLPAAKEALVFADDRTNRMNVVQYRPGELWAPLGKWTMYLLLADDSYVLLDSLEILDHCRQHYEFTIRQYQVQDSFREDHAELILRYHPELAVPPSGGSHSAVPLILKNPDTYSRYHIKGQVFDDRTHESIPYATVHSKRTMAGVVTSLDGTFDLGLNAIPDTLVVRYMGYRTEEIPWNGAKWLEIGIEEETVILDAVEIRTDRIRMHDHAYSISSTQTERVELLSVSAARMMVIPGLRSQGRETQYASVGDGDAQVPEFPAELLQEIAGTSTLRKDFRDGAIWEPALRSDRRGRATFRVRFPEDITRWDSYAIAVDRRGRTGLSKTVINSWKPLMGRLAMPRFFYEGDTVHVIGKVMNYTGDTVDMRRVFRAGEQQLAQRTGACGPVALDTLAVVPDMRQDSFILSYMADKADGYGDGEQWGVRVFPQGVKQASGGYAVLHGDTTYRLPLMDPSRGPIHIRLNTQWFKLLLAETARLGSYEHLCNEQLASKLLALLTEERIHRALGKEWEGKEDVQKILAMYRQRLDIKSDGWGWWPGMKAEPWVSSHVANALMEARKMGYQIPLHSVNWPSIHLGKLDKRDPSSNLSILEMVHAMDSTLPIRRHVENLDTAKNWGLADKLRIMELRQKLAMPVAVDSLWKWSHKNASGFISWGIDYTERIPSSHPSRMGYVPDMSMTLRAYRILRRAGASASDLTDIVSFILSQRRYDGWGNTYLTADILITLGRDIHYDQLNRPPRSTLWVDGVPMELPRDTAFTLEAGRQLSLRREGLGLSYFTAYQEWFDPQPVRKDSLFQISTRFLGVRDSILEAGKPVKMEVQVYCKESAEYLMLEIPIPSGCSYGVGNPSQSSGYQLGYYRENFRQKVCIYLRNMSPGTQSFYVDLLPRYTGSYTRNPVRIEDMYHPLVAGQSGMDRVEIR